MKLPQSLQVDTLAAMSLPGDLTVGAARVFTEKTAAFAFIRAQSRFPNLVKIRYLDNDGKEVPDEMTLRDLRRDVEKGLVHIVIDDGEGGSLVEA